MVHPSSALGGSSGVVTSDLARGGTTGGISRLSLGGSISGLATAAAGTGGAAAGRAGALAGASGAVGAAGAAGMAVSLPESAYYEIAIEPWNDPIGYDCGPLFAGTKLILDWTRAGDCITDDIECFEARVLRGTMFESSLPVTALVRNGVTLVLSLGAEPQHRDVLTETIERMTFDLGPQGFIGKGRATFTRTCQNRESIRYDRSLAIERDHLGPTMQVRERPYLLAHPVTWAPVELDADEPIVDATGLSCQAEGVCTPVFGLAWSDPAMVGTIATIPTHTLYPSMLVRDPASVAGQAVDLVPAAGRALVDLAGNPVTSWRSNLRFVDDQALVDRIDFDTDAPRGIVGVFEWISSSADRPRCESGRCLMLGPVQPCLFPREATFHSVWFNSGIKRSLRVRMAVETDNPAAQVSPAVLYGHTDAPSAGAIERPALVTIEELILPVGPYLPRAFPDGIFTHGSGFSTLELPLTSGTPLGAAVTIACGSDSLFTPVSARLFVEWYETAQ
jgi:hypothetical protein